MLKKSVFTLKFHLEKTFIKFFRGLFRTLVSSTYDGAFLDKYLMAKSLQLVSQKAQLWMIVRVLRMPFRLNQAVTLP